MLNSWPLMRIPEGKDTAPMEFASSRLTVTPLIVVPEAKWKVMTGSSVHPTYGPFPAGASAPNQLFAAITPSVRSPTPPVSSALLHVTHPAPL